MVSQKYVEEQLKKIGFNFHGWGRGEVSELSNIILPDEEIYECVNGIYDGGFALLVSSDIRVLLVDKKPLNYLTVEDMRFDMISEMDYSHRLLGARISISAGDKNLKFFSYNQPRLRKLIGHVQHCMAELKKRQSTHQEGQVQHLEKINQQLQAYLIAQHQHQQQLQQMAQQNGAQAPIQDPDPVRPGPELSDFLYAQSLMARHREETGQQEVADHQEMPPAPAQTAPQPSQGLIPLPSMQQQDPRSEMQELYEAGVQEIFGKSNSSAQAQHQPQQPQTASAPPGANETAQSVQSRQSKLPRLEINPITVAFSKLPMALRNRKFGKPSLPSIPTIPTIVKPPAVPQNRMRGQSPKPAR